MIFQHLTWFGFDAYAHEHRSLYKATRRIDVYIFDRDSVLMNHYIIPWMPDHRLKEWMMARLKDVSKCQSPLC